MIKVYSKPNCVQCDQTKRYLSKNDIEFEAIEMSEDDMTRWAADGWTSAPIVVTEKETWSGFRLEKLKNLIAHIRAERAKHVELK